MKKIQEIHKTDGFVTFDCGIGACPEIKISGSFVYLRNSRNPREVVKFSKKEMETLKIALTRES